MPTDIELKKAAGAAVLAEMEARKEALAKEHEVRRLARIEGLKRVKKFKDASKNRPQWNSTTVVEDTKE